MRPSDPPAPAGAFRATLLAALLMAVLLAAPATLRGQEPEDTVSPAAAASAMGAGNPLVPRGHFLFELDASSTSTRAFHRSGFRRPIADDFLPGELGVAEVPALAAPQGRFRELMGEGGSDWLINLGAVGGRFEANEQTLPVRVGYGLFDRISLGVTVPFVRRRISSVLGPTGAGANAGENPSLTEPDEVADFLSGAGASLASLEAQVAEACATDEENGVADPAACEEGAELLERAEGFLEELAAAYEEEVVFPLRGSGGAGLLRGRWADLRSELAGWEIEGPEAPPVATTALSDETFGGRFVEPLWGAEGFPRRSPETLLEVGDVEAHLVLGLLDSGTEGEGFRVRSSVVATARFPTGAVDSLQAVAPFHPPRGVAAGGVRLVTDVVAPSRFAVLGVVEGWWHGEATTLLLAPDPARILGETALTRLPARWRPGPAFRVRVTPRVHMTPSLSVGVGYVLDHRGAQEYETAEPVDVPLPGSAGGSTLHRFRAEARYHGVEDPVAAVLPFPLEIAVGYEGPITGSGPLAPVERRVRLTARVFRTP